MTIENKILTNSKHSGLKHTEKYTRAVDKLKEDAINSLPELRW